MPFLGHIPNPLGPLLATLLTRFFSLYVWEIPFQARKARSMTLNAVSYSSGPLPAIARRREDIQSY
jgi:hypothetical protein